jgi:hypothetical protein
VGVVLAGATAAQVLSKFLKRGSVKVFSTFINVVDDRGSQNRWLATEPRD